MKSIIRKARKSQGGKCKCQEIVVEADTVVVKNAKVEAEEISIETVEEVKTEADQVNVENIEESKSEVKESHVGTIEQSKAEIKEVKVDNIEEAKDTKIIWSGGGSSLLDGLLNFEQNLKT